MLQRINPEEHLLRQTEVGRFLSREIGLPFCTCQWRSHGGWGVVIRWGDQYIEEVRSELPVQDGRPYLTPELVHEIRFRCRKGTHDYAPLRQALRDAHTTADHVVEENAEAMRAYGTAVRNSAETRRKAGIRPNHIAMKF